MSKKITVGITRSYGYEVEVPDDFDPDSMGSDVLSDFMYEAGEQETDDIVTERMEIFDAQARLIYSEH